MDLQPTRQLDYLQRTLTIFLTNSSDMSEQLESLIDELIQENKQINKSPKSSPEPVITDFKSEVLSTTTSPQPLPKKRSAPLAANSKPPPSKRLKTLTSKEDDESSKKKTIQVEEKNDKDDDIYDDENDSDDIKVKPSESQTNPSTSSSRDIDEFAIELGLVCFKCKLLAEEKDNRLVECHECHNKYHQKCHKPLVSTADISDPRCLWYCSKCRKIINKKQQSQSSLKETKVTSNSSSSSTTKSKTNESPLSTAKKSIPSSISDVSTGLFSFKPKSSESITSDNSISNNPSISNSNSSLTNGTTTKNTNGWASLATGFKEKKTTTESTNSSATSILAELTALTSSTNSNNTKHSPPSPKSLTSTSLNPLLKQSINNNIGTTSTTLLKNTNPSIKYNIPSSPPVLKTQLSSSKSTQKLISTTKNLQRISSPTPLGRQTSIIKSPPSATTPVYNRLNSSGSNSSGSNSPSSTSANTKIATGFDFEKRLKQMKKMAAEKSLTKKI
ncbi:unnamed protein product [Adineta steineri]|uniref:Integrator complex subunit 12 n=1 Tax=Adineta steineri TaxID=433720 RepID=A0A818FIX6_9BILA|nr:unnamed protein product [Adineta steineri]CAF0750331.1 unnamed protein product [Adineta steineri]CAF3475940.1 unnamed protein product [Adineta steineri]CAF3501119.1 unnamed protein product [Adineta steineri]